MYISVASIVATNSWERIREDNTPPTSTQRAGLTARLKKENPKNRKKKTVRVL